MRSLRLHRTDTSINSYRVCRLERQIAIVSSIVQTQRFRKLGGCYLFLYFFLYVPTDSFSLNWLSENSAKIDFRIFYISETGKFHSLNRGL